MTLKHDWIPSTLGHGELMCARCKMTNREAVALRKLNRCEEKRTEEELADRVHLKAIFICCMRARGLTVLNIPVEDAALDAMEVVLKEGRERK